MGQGFVFRIVKYFCCYINGLNLINSDEDLDFLYAELSKRISDAAIITPSMSQKEE